MLQLNRSSSETRHSYQSTGTRSGLSGLASRLGVGRHREEGSSADASHEPQSQMAPQAGGHDDRTSFSQMALLYAIFLTLLGLIFPLSYYVSPKPLSEWYLVSFYIVIYVVAIGYLIFYMAWVMSRPSQSLFLETMNSSSGELVQLQEAGQPPGKPGKVEFQIGRFNVSESSPNLKEMDNAEEDGYPNAAYDDNGDLSEPRNLPQIRLEEPEVDTPIDEPSTSSAQSSTQQSGRRHVVSFDAQTTLQSNNNDTLSKQKRLKRINSTFVRNAREFGVHEIQSYSVLSQHESHSPSFFVRVACFLFGGLKMTHEVLHVVDTLTSASSGCYEPTASGKVIQYILGIIFTILQTFFIFKYSKVSVNIYQKLSTLGFMHLMATNMCVWFEAILLETSHNAKAKSTTYKSNHTSNSSYNATSTYHSTDASHNSHDSCSKDVFWRMAPYLFPFTIEYSLMAAFSCYVLYCNVGKFLDVILTKGFNVGKKCLRNRKKSQTNFSGSCYKSDKGFFLGGLQMIIGVVSGIYFTIYIHDSKSDRLVSKHIFLLTDLLLLSFNFVLCILALLRLRNLTLLQKMTTGPDSWLLGITLMGVLAFEMFQLFGAAAEVDYFVALRVCKGLMCIFQSTFQVFVVFDGEKRRSQTEEMIEQKPGREMIAALLLGNLAMWVVYTLEVREINNLPNFNDAYVTIASEIFAYVCSPLIIFFRFHSACCFVEIWRHAYKGKDSQKPKCKHQNNAADNNHDTASIRLGNSFANVSDARSFSKV